MGRALTAQQLRAALRDGVMEIGRMKDLPPPPVEWRPWKREKLARDARAAYLFLAKGFTADKIARAMELTNGGGEPVSKQRINQLVKRGCRFLVDRRFIRKAEN